MMARLVLNLRMYDGGGNDELTFQNMSLTFENSGERAPMVDEIATPNDSRVSPNVESRTIAGHSDCASRGSRFASAIDTPQSWSRESNEFLSRNYL